MTLLQLYINYINNLMLMIKKSAYLVYVKCTFRCHFIILSECECTLAYVKCTRNLLTYSSPCTN